MPSSRPPSRASDRRSTRAVGRAAVMLDETKGDADKGNEVVAPGRAWAEAGARGAVGASEARKAPARMGGSRAA